MNEEPLPKKWKERISRIRDYLGDSSDLVLLPIAFGNKEGALLYYTSLTDQGAITDKIMKPLGYSQSTEFTASLERFRAAQLSVLEYRYADVLSDLASELLGGSAALLAEGEPQALTVRIGGIRYRAIEEPKVQTSIQGPKEGFTESLESNISLIRRRIRNRHLKFKAYDIGEETHNRLVVAYLEDLAPPALLDDLDRRLRQQTPHASFDVRDLVQFAEGRRSRTLFPSMKDTERTDTAAFHLNEGRVAVMLDGSPYVHICPALFTDFFRTTEDAYKHSFIGLALQFLRYFAFAVSFLLPAMYIGIANYNIEIIPVSLMLSISGQRSNAPFPSIVELLMIEATFEILREAALRMPRAVGPALTIVGALVIGEAVVASGLVSNILLIVVALSAVSSYAVPYHSFNSAVRIIRFTFTAVASLLGMYGVFLWLIAFLTYLSGLRSFGYPYIGRGREFASCSNKQSDY